MAVLFCKILSAFLCDLFTDLQLHEQLVLLFGNQLVFQIFYDSKQPLNRSTGGQSQHMGGMFRDSLLRRIKSFCLRGAPKPVASHVVSHKKGGHKNAF